MKIEIDIDEKYPDIGVKVTTPALTPEVERIVSLIRIVDMQIPVKKDNETVLGSSLASMLGAGVGDEVEVKITEIDRDKKRISLSMRALLPEDEPVYDSEAEEDASEEADSPDDATGEDE